MKSKNKQKGKELLEKGRTQATLSIFGLKLGFLKKKE